MNNDLDHRVRSALNPGAVVTEADASVYTTLAHFAAVILHRDLHDLQLRDLAAHIQSRSTWPHPMRRASDRLDAPPLRHPTPCFCRLCRTKARAHG
jgi:hypothetical protein